jgi:hypothetical protein
MTPIFPAHTPEPTKQARTALAALTQNFMNTAKYLQSEANAGAADMRQTRALPDGAGIEAIVANIAALAHAQQDAISLNASVQDWDMMFRAVEERLSSAVGKVLVATPGLEPQTAAVLVQTIVLECVTALGQLHTALTLERGRRQQLEQETGDAQAALARGLASTSLPGPESGGFVS